jgi:4-amino-4-deoxy-L-arabinose transferase-like glycosyltransferase
VLTTGWRPRRVGVAAAVSLAVAAIPRVLRVGGPDYDWDDGVYWQSLEALRHGHRLFAEVYSSQPPLFLAGLELPFRLLGGGIVGARLPVVALSLLGMVAAYFIGRSWGGPWAGVLAALLMAFDPLYLRLSDVVEADLPSAVWGLVAVALAAEGRYRHAGDRWWLLAGAALGLGIQTKLLAVAFVTPVALLAVSGSTRATARRLALAGAAAIVVAVAILLPFAGDLGQVYRGVIGLHLGARVGEPQTLAEKIDVFGHAGIGPVTLLAAAAGTAVATLLGRGWVVVAAAWLATALLVDAVQGPLFTHHVVIVVAPLAVMGGTAIPLAVQAGVARAPGFFSLLRPVVVAATTVGGLALVVAVGLVNHPGPADPGTAPLSAAIRAHVPAGTTVVSDNQFAAASAGFWAPPSLVDTSFARISAGDLDGAQLEQATDSSQAEAIVFGTNRLMSIPGFPAWVKSHYRLVDDLGNGRQVWLRR